ncbi:Hypothetical protein GLP15_152 [Giardia lamblia P15]|uniref:Uncharacterized protein n=1 Tax=Giardia intestinalis (strain P15) TaxID=658858 RepID=E1EY54_GIAIA|nr:Hypothetical protein GLP15_152 [Giardia lamblia P15]
MSSSGNRRYLREHPELKAITTLFISEVIYVQPPNILQFAVSFFRSRRMQDYVAQSFGYQDKDAHIAVLRSAALSTTSSSIDLYRDGDDNEVQANDYQSTRDSSSSSIDKTYRCLLNLSEQLGEVRRHGDLFNDTIADSTSFPGELSSDILTANVSKLLINAEGLQDFVSTLPKTLLTRRAAHLLKGLVDTFKSTSHKSPLAVSPNNAPSTSIPPITLSTLLPLVNDKLWGSTCGSEQHSGTTSMYETKLPGHTVGSTLDSTLEISHMLKQLSSYHRPGLFVGDWDMELPTEMQELSIPHQSIVTENIAFRFPTVGASTDTNISDDQHAGFAECKVIASKSFVSTFFQAHDKLKEIDFVPLDPSLLTIPSILVQHTIGYLLSCPLLVPVTVHLRSSLSSCLFISRGGLLQWCSLLDFSSYKFKSASVTAILDANLLASTTLKTTLEQSQSQAIVNSAAQTETPHVSMLSSLPTITASGKIKFSNMLSQMETSYPLSERLSDDKEDKESTRNDPVIFTTDSIPPLGVSPRQQRYPTLLYKEVSPDLLTFFRAVAPHISGIGAEEYAYGLLDICTFLPNTYFCCANLEIEEGIKSLRADRTPFKGMTLDAGEVYIGKLCPSLPLRYLFSVNSIFSELGYGCFRLFKYLPVIVKGSYPHAEPNSICVVFTSILPTTHCDNIIPGRSVLTNLQQKGSSVPLSSYYEFYTLPPSARLLEGINVEVHRMLEKAQIYVSAVRYVLLSSTTSYGRSTSTFENTGNFLSNSWIETYILPDKTTPNYTSQTILRFHEFMNYAYKSPEYSELLYKPYNYDDPRAVDVSVAAFFSLWDIAEEDHIGAMPVRNFTGTIGSSALSKPYKHLFQTKLVTIRSYKDYLSQMQPLQRFVQRDVMAKFPLVLDKLLYRDLLSCKVLPWLGPVEYVSFLAKTVHTPLFCYLAHKLRDCACYYLPIISDHKRSLLIATDEGEKEAECTDLIVGLTTDLISRLNNRMTDQKLHPSTTIDLVACFSAKILTGGTPSYEANDVHHDSMVCTKYCSTTAVKSRIYQTRSVVYPDNTVSSFLATFPSLFSTDAQLYLTRLTLSQLLDALCHTYSLAFDSGQRSVHIVCDSLPYLTNVGLYYDTSKTDNTGSFLFNLERFSHDLVSQLKYSVTKDTIVSKVEENYTLFEKSHILELVHKHRITREDMEKSVLLLTDKYMLNSPIGIARKLMVEVPSWEWSPMVIPLRVRRYNQIDEKYEFDDNKEPISLHLTAGHALVGRYYPGLDPERGICVMEDHMRRAIYSIPFPIVSSSGIVGGPSATAWSHLLEVIH